jgi:hypothetical protein
MKPDSIADLKLFLEKSDVLLASRFADAMIRTSSGFMLEWHAGRGCEAILVGAEGESVDAAFLTLRMFLQNNDRLSIGNIAKIYSGEPELSSFQSEFEELRQSINGFLDQRNGIDFFGKHYTNREAIELLMYGTKGHTNREKEAEVKALLEIPIVAPMFLNQVNSAAAVLIRGIEELAKINKKALLAVLPHGV